MVEEFDEQEYDRPIRSYEELVTEEPERDIDLEDMGMPKSLTEAEEETEHRTDLQTAMRYLVPKFKNKRVNDLMQTAMMSRIMPDNYIDKHFLITAALIEEHDPEDDVDVVAIISQVQDGLSIGYEGRGRIDILETAGVAHEEELEKISKELGL